jgi:CHAT domain-containing protein
VGDRAGEGGTLHNLGEVYQAQGRTAEALDSLQAALAIRREVGDRAGEGGTLNKIGAVYEAQGRYDEALASLQAALTIAREVGDRAGEGETLHNLGEVSWAQGRTAEALDRFQSALAIRREVGDRAGEGETLHNLGRVYEAQGRYTKAQDSYQQAIEILEALRTIAGSEQSRASFIAQFASVYNDYTTLLHRQGQHEEAFLISERGRARAFLDSLATGQVQLRDDAAAELLAQEQELYAQRRALQDNLAQARAQTPPDAALISELESQLAEVEDAYADIQAQIQARSDQLADLMPGRSQNVLGVAEGQAHLDEQTTLVSYFVLEHETLVFLISRDDFQTFALDVSRAELGRAIRNFRDFATLDEAHPESAIKLYNWLMEPLKEKLTTPHLAIIPHNVLHYLPFAALTDGERSLIDDYTLTILPSASSLPFILENTSPSALSLQPSALVIGNPTTGDYDATASFATERAGLRPLPFAEKEAKAIAELYGVEPLIGTAATEGAVREQVGEANILHLAAHGKFNPVAPLNSLIALAPDEANDGWLTVGEAYGLNLAQTDLVVLSACQTNLGDLSEGDELVGLTRAFIFAGTPTVIASLWNVEDEATSLLMEHFYTHLREGMGKAEALRQAQLEVREEYPNPYYWSAFVLSGDGGIVPGSKGAEEQGGAVTPEASVATPPASEADTEAARPGGNCLSLLVMVSLLGVVGVIAKGRGDE